MGGAPACVHSHNASVRTSPSASSSFFCVTAITAVAIVTIITFTRALLTSPQLRACTERCSLSVWGMNTKGARTSALVLAVPCRCAPFILQHFPWAPETSFLLTLSRL